ncbi:MAG: anhydro-N-acetylmuramic acid kinase [Gammaproteobacteria bacterium]|nr:anhydro-N-acetylmuramic acid kinase [Gammaproteobacteria bacterium]
MPAKIPAKTEFYVGLISGTSMDGVDAAVVAFNGDNRPTLVHGKTFPIPAELISELHQLAAGDITSLATLCHTDVALGEVFAQAVTSVLADAGISPEQVAAVGSHGQTVFHGPREIHRCTLQIGDPNVIAERTGITTVADFRRRDMAAGGEGAPLLPAFHHGILASPHTPRVILNIGGIANITVLAPKASAPLSGFDTGPGNTLMDAWIRHHQNKAFDQEGRWARTGSINNDLLEAFLREPYFQRPPPKSTGRELFNTDWLFAQLEAFEATVPAQDVQRTLLRLTSSSIATAIEAINLGTAEILVAGGGAHNTLLMEDLQDQLLNTQIGTVQSQGISVEFLEAMAFAWFAKCRMQMIPATPAHITGATHRVVLGAIYAAAVPINIELKRES